MCGIVAYYSTSKPIETMRLVQSLDSIQHRGPDASHFWHTDTKLVALGHTRLSIIDLDTGNQPLHSHDGTIHAVVNGEFYGFEEIRDSLRQKGYRFQTLSDSEILIALYQEYGFECLNYLRGEFAFVLWDEKNQQLFAARDRFGIKPLFYGVFQGNLYFASEAKALFALGYPCEWDMEMIHSHEHFLPSQADTIFKGIKAIKPGYFILARKDTIKTQNYWDFNYPSDQSDFSELSEEELILEFRKLLEESVRLRLRADVPVGCYLSGGLDSCSVLGLMNHIRQKPIDTFTISFNDSLYDEAAVAKEMSDLVGSNHHCFQVDEQILCDHFSDTVYHNESLIFNNNTVAKFLLSRYTQQAGYKVILTGEGSDEVLAGYPIFREDMIRYDNKDQDKTLIEALVKQLHEANKASHGLFSTSSSSDELQQVENLLGYIPSMMKATTAGGQVLSSLHNSNFKTTVSNNDPLSQFFNQLNLSQINGRTPLIKSLYLWSKSILPGYILVQLGDRMEMAHSLEGRVPFLDHKLVEFLTKTPNYLKINGLNEKYILREAVKDIITDTVYKRQKHPFLAPPSSMNKNPFQQLMADTFNSTSLKHSPFYDQQKVLTLFHSSEKLPADKRQELDKVFMHILSVCTIDTLFRPTTVTSLETTV